MMTTLVIGNRRGGRAGFSLIELSIVVFIIAIIMAVSVPSFIRSYNAATLNATGRSIITTCQFAKLNAVLRQQKVAFYIDMDNRKISLTQFAGTNAPDSSDSSTLNLKTLELSPRIGVASVQIGDQPAEQKGQVEATFYPNGTCDAFTVTLRGAEKGSGLAIMVDPVTCRGLPWVVKL
jgi:prepilin-type N-terminal cleavage/methylation domain-containing protein